MRFKLPQLTLEQVVNAPVTPLIQGLADSIRDEIEGHLMQTLATTTVRYTSDLHFGHVNIIPYSNRPFTTLDGHPDVPAMNRAIIEGWNRVASPSSTVFVLGDFGMGSWKEWAGLRKRLNGRIILILGNHDRKLDSYLLPGDFAMDSLLTRDGVFMTHVPPKYDDHAEHYKLKVNPVPEGAKLILCGHVHDRWARGPDYNGVPVLNVGVDVRGYVPLTLEQILAQEGLDNVLG